MKLKLTAKLLIPLVALVILGLGVSTLVAYISARNALERSVTGQIRQISESAASKVGIWINHNKMDIDVWSRQDVMGRSLAGNSDSKLYRTVASAKMKAYIEQYKTFSGMRLANRQGVVVASSHAKNIGSLNVSARTYFTASMRGEIFVSPPLLSKTTGKPVLVVSAPVRAGNEIRGVLYGVVDLGEFSSRHIDSIKVGETGYLYMLNARGLVLSYPDKESIMKLNLGEFAFGKEMLEKRKGVMRYEFNGVEKLVAFEEIPETGWLVAATAPTEEVLAGAFKIRNLLIIIGAVSTAALFVGIMFLVSFFVIRPLKSVIGGLKDIARGEGDLTHRLDLKTEDELGELAEWFNTFIENLQMIIRDISSNAGAVDASSGELLDIATSLSEGAEGASGRTSSVAASSEEMGGRINTIRVTMEETRQNTDMVATAAREMSSTIDEIAQNSERARSVSVNAVDQATRASEKMNHLATAAASIGAVTETIAEISEQTNLLALNATIEAARAGEAGKGFAVVANEIKELAQQTAAATSDIKVKIDGIQGTTAETSTEINSITGIINDINEIISSIAAAIEEQSVATGEISNNVSQSSEGIREVSGSITEGASVMEQIAEEVASADLAVGEISRNSHKVEVNAEELKQMAAKLSELIGKFKF